MCGWYNDKTGFVSFVIEFSGRKISIGVQCHEAVSFALYLEFQQAQFPLLIDWTSSIYINVR